MKKYASIVYLFTILMIRLTIGSELSANQSFGFCILSTYLKQDTSKSLKYCADLLEATKKVLITNNEYNEAIEGASDTYNQQNDENDSSLSDACVDNRSRFSRMIIGFVSNSGISAYQTAINNGFSAEQIHTALNALRAERPIQQQRPNTDFDINKKRYFEAKKKFLNAIEDLNIAIRNVDNIIEEIFEEMLDYLFIGETCKDFNIFKNYKDQILIYSFTRYYRQVYLKKLFNKKSLNSKTLEKVNLTIDGINEDQLDMTKNEPLKEWTNKIFFPYCNENVRSSLFSDIKGMLEEMINLYGQKFEISDWSWSGSSSSSS